MLKASRVKTSNALVLSSWLCGSCLSPCLAAEPDVQSPGVVQKVEQAIVRGADAAAAPAEGSAPAEGAAPAAPAPAEGAAPAPAEGAAPAAPEKK